jgi:hypothetical protein
MTIFRKGIFLYFVSFSVFIKKVEKGAFGEVNFLKGIKNHKFYDDFKNANLSLRQNVPHPKKKG